MDQLTKLPTVLLLCGLFGFCLKHYIPLNNKHIPTILAVTGAILSCLISQTVSAETIALGAVYGLASTGTHQLLRGLYDGKKADYGDGQEFTERKDEGS